MRHVEHDLQSGCVRWFRYNYPQLARLLFAVPNGGSRNAREGGRLKAEGVTAGVADLLLLVPAGGYGSLCIEMKTSTGRQRETQREWQHDVEKVGNKYVICRTLDDFMREVQWYLQET